MEHQMRARLLCVVGVSTTALVLSGLSVGAASASAPDAVPSIHSATGVSGTPTSFPDALCGTAEGTWASDGLTSQDGAPLNPALNTWGAKQVKCKKALKVKQIVVDGYPSQSMDINFNIEVFKTTKADTVRFANAPQPNDAKKSICSLSAQPGKYAAAGVSGAQWTIDLSKTCKVAKKLAKKGVWFGVQASLDQTFGQWFWATQTTAGVPIESDWRDTGNLFGLGCVAFTNTPSGSDKLSQDCVFGGDNGQPDYIMVLN
jgi:hypothetical protein